MTRELRTLSVPEGVAGERIDSALTRVLGLSRDDQATTHPRRGELHDARARPPGVDGVDRRRDPMGHSDQPLDLVA